MSYSLYAFFGVLPSIIWLLFYLRKDVHPESNHMVLRIFFYGMLAAFPALLFELGIQSELAKLNISTNIITILNVFIAVALVEESLKYLVVKGKVLVSSELDEPIDIMLYMIIAALGFAAVENILILFSLGPVFLIGNAFSISVLRFVGATFLHALVSGTMGYFLALSIFEIKNRIKYVLLGLGIAVFLHGLYNFSIIDIRDELSFLIPVLILLGLASFLTFGFQRLKKIKSICKI